MFECVCVRKDFTHTWFCAYLCVRACVRVCSNGKSVCCLAFSYFELCSLLLCDLATLKATH